MVKTWMSSCSGISMLERSSYGYCSFIINIKGNKHIKGSIECLFIKTQTHIYYQRSQRWFRDGEVPHHIFFLFFWRGEGGGYGQEWLSQKYVCWFHAFVCFKYIFALYLEGCERLTK